MADLTIKPVGAAGNKLILQDQAGGAVLTTADSGATIANATLTSPALTSPTLTGTATAVNLTVSGDLVPSTPLSHRNMIINGAMNVAQRGTQVTGYNSSAISTCDRFGSSTTGIGSLQIDQASITDLDGFSNSWKHTYTFPTTSTSTSGYHYAWYKVEAQDLQRARTSGGAAGTKPMVLSFYVKTSWADTFYTVIDAEDGTIRRLSFSYTTAANTWKRVVHVLPADTVAQFDNNNGTGLAINWWLASGSNYTGGTGVGAGTWNNYTNANQNCVDDPGFSTNGRTWEITGVQLELGSNVTPFEYRSYGEELARCQRYFQTYNPTQQQLVYNEDSAATHKFTMFYIMNSMRAAPSVSLANLTTGGGVGGLSGTVSSLNVSSSPIPNPPCVISCRVNMSTSSGTGRAMYHADAWASDALEYSAEL